MAEQTQKIIEENKMVDRIDVIHNTVEVCYVTFDILVHLNFYYIGVCNVPSTTFNTCASIFFLTTCVWKTIFPLVIV